MTGFRSIETPCHNDSLGRRVHRKADIDGDGILDTDIHYYYDCWNVIETETSSGFDKAYIWGIDLSGTQQGAGGVGGLIAVEKNSGTFYALNDANGNVVAYTDSTGNIVAEYNYTPFGNLAEFSGTMADEFVYRFSTKSWLPEIELYDFGRRYYSPELGRFINRDLIGEDGGLNLFAYTGNSPISRWDMLGLWVDETQILSPVDSIFYVKTTDFVYTVIWASLVKEIMNYNTTIAIHLIAWKNLGGLASIGLANWPGAQGRGNNHFVFTCKYGWIDMGHFFNSATVSYGLKGNADSAYDLGVFIEHVQFIPFLSNILNGNPQGGWSDSAYTPEDLPSDYQGSIFGRRIYMKDKANFHSNKLEHILIPTEWENFLKEAGAVPHNKNVKDILIRDVRAYMGERRYTYNSCIQYAKNSQAYKCLCNGDKPRK